MFRLIYYELYKMMCKRIVLVILLCISFVILFRTYQNCQEKNWIDQSVYQELREQPRKQQMELCSTEQERSALFYLQRQQEYCASYPAFLDGIIHHDANKTIGIFRKKDSYTLRNQEKSIEDYRNLEGIQVYPDYEQGILALNSDPFTILLLFTMVLFVGGVIFQEGNDNSLQALSSSCKRGRGMMNAARAIAFTMVSAIICMLTLLGRLLIAKTVLGFGEYARPIQSVSAFRNCSYRITVGEYLMLQIAVPMIAILILCMMVPFFFRLFENLRFSCGMLILYLGISYLCYYRIDDLSIHNLWKYLNLFPLMDTDSFFGKYRNINLHGKPYSLICGPGIVGCISLLLLLLYLIPSLGFRIRLPHRSRRHGRPGGSVSLVLHEHRQFFLYGFRWLFLVIMFFVGRQHLMQESLVLTDGEYLYYEYYKELQNVPQENWMDWMNQKGQSVSFDAGMNLSEYGQTVEQAAVERIYEQYYRLLPAMEKGYTLQFTNRIATDYVFDHQKDILLPCAAMILVVMFATINIFGVNIQSGMDDIVQTTRSGGGRIFRMKYAMIFFFSVCMILMYLIPHGINWVKWYRMCNWNAPVQSIVQLAGVSGRGSILHFCILWGIQILLTCLCFAVLWNVFFTLCQRKSRTIMVSIAYLLLDVMVVLFRVPVLSELAISAGIGLPGVVMQTGHMWIVWAELGKEIVLLSALLRIHYKRIPGN